MLGLTPTASGEVKFSAEPLGKGGEGSVFAVLSHTIPGIPEASKLVAKIYHAPEEENRKAKLKAMVTAPVSDDSVAWPQALVFDAQKQFQGYLMVKLEKASNREWLYLANVKERNRVAPDFDTRYALMAMRNLAAAILSVHSAGHLVGDINESNIFVKADASVLIVDSDSMQITDARGAMFPCVVGKPEYTAPELSYGSFRDNPRTSATDAFAFAVASFQLLTGGVTPHQGAFDPNSDDDPMSTVDRIRKGVLPALAPARAKTFGFTPRPGTPVAAFPSFLRKHLIAFLSPEPAQRETAELNLETLIREIDAYAPTLVRCSKERLHWHEPVKACLWCAEAARTGVDPWGTVVAKSAPAQISLPSIGFSDGSAPKPPASRAAPAIAGQQAHQANQHAGGLPTGGDPLQALLAANPGLLQAAAALNTPPGATAVTPAATRPKLIKGKVTVEYADGSWGVRPPLSVLLKQSPKMWLWAVKEETWPILKFWWPVDRKLANPAALVFGFVFSILLVVANSLMAKALLVGNFVTIDVNLAIMLSLIPAATSLITVIWLLCSALKDRAKTKKKNGSLDGFEVESPIVTILRFIPVALFYGVPAVVLGTVAGVFTLVRTIAKAEK
jgi:serine/threonine protein kinase